MFYVAFYNTENFFPPDTPFLPFWSRGRYLRKRKRIADAFQQMEDTFGILPAIIGLAEVGSKTVVKELLDMPVFNNRYAYVHYESLDERGIDVAVAYDKKRLNILHSEPIRFQFQMENRELQTYTDTTRDVLYVRFELLGTPLHYYLVHLPSKRNKDINLDRRNTILGMIKSRVEQHILKEKEAVLVCGDFNENPNAENMQDFRYYRGVELLLDNPFLSLYYQKEYSTYHHKEGLLYDQILHSLDFYKVDMPIQYSHAIVFAPMLMRQSQVQYRQRPWRTFSGTRYLGGYSDHFPVLSFFKHKNVDDMKN